MLFRSFLRGDPGRVRQILTNLVGNAVKFTAKGEVFLHVSLESENEQQATLRFAVVDTGIGIPQNRLDALFQPFTQADASTTRKYGGTGLGLSISRRLAELMGGRVGATSEEGKGSTFWFTSVFKKQEARGFSVEMAEDLRGVRILIVDDNATNRRALAAQLQHWHCQWDEAEDAETALRKLREGKVKGSPFRFAILDMLMPGMSGEDLGLAIRKDPGFSEMLLVMMTSVGRRGDASRLEKMGFSAYLTKPVKSQHLYDCLRMLLKNKPPAAEASEKTIITRHKIAEVQKQSMRILLAEDNRLNQIVAEKIIEKLGFPVDTVSNGLEAIQALQKVPYDLVFMDVQMPEMDGLEATRQIRKSLPAGGEMQVPVCNTAVPIIAMTAHAMAGYQEKCLEAGMNDYLTKPVQAEKIAEAIERWMGKKDSARPPFESGTFSPDKAI